MDGRYFERTSSKSEKEKGGGVEDCRKIILMKI
jgi:hypothetical protein